MANAIAETADLIAGTLVVNTPPPRPEPRGPVNPVLLIAALFLVAATTVAQAQDVQGTVFEITTAGRVPSAKAFVIVHWTGRRPGFGHYESVCIQAAIGRTDALGRFAVAEPRPLRSTFLVFRNDPAVAVWKPGFDTSPELPVNGAWNLIPTKATAEMRIAMAEGLRHYGCSDERGMLLPLTDPQGVLADFQRALAAEAPVRAQEKWEVRILNRAGSNPASR
jgi:hypothetical protein